MNDQQQTRADARTYTTQPGESVAGIALRQCGSEDEWRNIIALNPEFSEHTACDYFPVGTVLTLPPLPVSRTVAAPIARVQVCGDEITLSATSDQRAVLMTMHDAPIYAEPLSATSANETGAEGLDQFERIDVQNHVLRRTLQRVMARLTDLLDEDQFGNIESIVKEAGVEPPAIAAAAPADDRAAFEAAMVAGGYHEPERSPFGGDAYKYERDQDRFVGFCLGLAARAGAAPQPAQADEPTSWDRTRHSLAVAMLGFASRPELVRRNLDAAASMLDSLTEPGLPLAWLRNASAKGAAHDD
ncbi:TPA: hypothetical protein ACXM9H_000993 [Burkholderia multivorans]|uniref:hypothetical protein n=1 Tax=Burkholderia multivorans TaxID=87883 RepID=UPI000CFF3306|nr:hypothetical protein [Burkholderia multivorans]PRD74773.1 hypothetical protein C6P75_12330 [Burkholderia multivorans]